MSTIVDERVVEMRFDNQQFEEGVRESMTSLSKMNEILNKSDSVTAFKNLDRSLRDIRLDGIAAGVEALQKRFSLLGLVGIKALNGIADTLLSTTRKLYSATIGQIWSGGIRRAMNMENARFQLQALFSKEENAAELVTQVMADANKAVDGTAYSLDAAAKAASQFAATGIKAGEEMQGALRGIVGVAAMTNTDFESISNVFTTVAGQGRVMGDQLNQLAARGLNAAATMADFVNGVINGSIEASDEVTALVKTFSKGTKVTEGDIRDLTSKGKISFKLFSEAMTDAFADSAEKANETFTGALSNVKSALARIGAGFISPLIAQNSEIVKLFNALRVKINEFKKAIVFDEEYGNVYAISKLFTDWVLKMANALTTFVNNIDTAGIMRDFYYGLKIVMNVFKALWVAAKPALMAASGLIKPIGEALHTIVVALEAVTSRMIASEGTLTSFGEVLKAIVEIFGTLISGVLKLIQKVFKPLNKETETTQNGFKNLLDIIAVALNQFNKWLNTSPLISKVFNILASAIKKVISVGLDLGRLFTSGIVLGLAYLIKGINKLADIVKNAKSISSVVDKIRDSFSKLSKISLNVQLPQTLKDYIEQARLYTERVGAGLPVITQSVLTGITTLILALGSFGKILANGIKGIAVFGKRLLELYKDSITLENLKKVFTSVTEAGGKFITFVLDSAKSLTGIFVGGGIMYMILKTVNTTVGSVDKVLTGFSKVLTSTSGVLDQTKKTLKAYQHDLNASALIKIAGAIAILSASLIMLSFADTKRVLESAIALSLVGGVLIAGLSVFEKLVNRTKNIYTVMDTLAKQIGKAAKWKAIGEAIKSLGEAVLMIAGSIVAIALMYKHDSAAMNEAVKLIAAIGLCIVGLMTTMSLLGNVIGSGMKSFSLAAFGIAAIASSVLIVITALNKLFKMDLPLDYKRKLDILYGIILSLSGLTIVFSLISNIGHGGKGNTIPILHLFLSLHAVISALQRLFKMDLPVDYQKKINILNQIFISISAVMAAMALASRIAGRDIKMGGTILALSLFITSVVGALAILTLFPLDKIYGETIALSGIMIALGAAILLASKYIKPETAKTVLNMGILIGAITASLAALSLFDARNLLKGATALSVVILSIGNALESASKVQKAMSLAGIIAMLVGVAEIAYALYKISTQPWQGMLASGVAMALVIKAYSDAFETLGDANAMDFKMIGKFLLATLAAIPLALALYAISTQPWQGMLASGVAMGITLKSYAEAFKVLGDANAIDLKQVGKFILATTASIPLALSLAVLAHQPWAGMLTAGVAMSGTLIAFSKAFEILSKSGSIDVKKVGNFLLATVSVIPIGLALGVLSYQPWDGMLGAAVALSATLLAFSGCFAIITKTATPDLKLAAEFVAASVALIPIAVALKIVSGEPWGELLGAAASISLVLIALAATMDICIVAGKFAKEAAIGMGLLAGFIAGLILLLGVIGGVVNVIDKYFNGGASNAITRGIEILQQVGEGLGGAVGSFIYGIGEGLTNRLYVIADNLALFMEHLKPFTDGLKNITEDSINGVMMLGEMIVSLTKAEVLQGFTNLFGGNTDFAALGEQLSLMAPYLQSFSDSVAGISPESVAGAKTVAEIMLALSDALPRFGGIIDKVLGQKKTLTDFAVELNNFGPAIASFAETVKYVDPASVEGAKSAAMVMLEVANNLPPADGLMQKIFGQKTLADFAAELDEFGPSIVRFSNRVKNVKADSVEGAARAGMIMAALAEELPSNGGVLGWLLGDNDLATFGMQLESYGDSIVTFADKVKDIDPESLNGVATATAMMSALSDALPETEGVLSIFTGGTMDFEEFGKQLDKFGKSLKKYSDSTSDIDFGMINESNVALTSLIDMFKSAKGVESDSMRNFALALSSTPGIAIQEFVTGIQNGDVLVRDSIKQMFTNLTAEINNAYGPLLGASKSLIDKVAASLTLYLLIPFGKTITKMTEIGEYIGQGLADGINNKTEEVRTAAQNMAEIVEEVTRTQLQINSPSKLAIEIGSWWPKSLAVGITKGSKSLRKATIDTAKVVEKATRNTMKIHSLSPLYEEIGEWVPESIGSGVEKGKDKLEEAANNVSDFFNKSNSERIKKAADFAAQKAEDAFGDVVYEVFPDWKQMVEKVTGEAVDTVKESTEKVTNASGASQRKSIKQEKTYWEKLLAIKKAGVEKSKYKDMDIVKFQKSILEESTELWKNYIENLESTRDSIMSSVDLFTEKYTAMGELNPFEELKKNEEEALTKDTLTKNLNDQVERYRNYYKTLQKLISRIGETSDFSDYLRTLGVDSYDQLKALNSMADSELSKYVSTYEKHLDYVTDITKKKNVQTKEQLVKGLTDQIEQYKDHAEQLQIVQARLGEDSELGDYLRTLGVDSVEQLRVINSMTDEELTNYAQLYDTKMAYATNIASTQLIDLQRETEAKLADLFGGMADAVNMFDFAAVFDGTFESIDNFVTGIMLPLEEFKLEAARMSEELGPPIVAGLEESFDGETLGSVMSDGLQEAVNIVREEGTENLTELGTELGGNFSDGVGTAISEATFQEAATTMVDTLVGDLQTAGEIHSPSKLTEREVGVHLAEGVATGLNNADAQNYMKTAIVELLRYIIATFMENQEPLDEYSVTIGGAIRDGMMKGAEGFSEDIATLTTDTVIQLNKTWNEDDLFKIGTNLITFIQNGVLFVRPSFMEDIALLCTDTIDTFVLYLNEETLGEIGQNTVLYIDQGVKSVQNVLIMTCYRLCWAIVNIFRAQLSYNILFGIGTMAIQGLIDGMDSKLSSVVSTATKIANAAVDTMTSALAIHSPSRVAYEIGRYITQGLANGMAGSVNLVHSAGETVSDDAIKSINLVKDAIVEMLLLINDDSFNPEITLTPTVNLSQVRTGVNEITSLFNRATANTKANVMATASSFNGSRSAQQADKQDKINTGSRLSPNYNFIQNNYSPKALSRIEIYRQTQNQFRQFKEATR